MPEKKPTRTADLDYFYGQSSELFSFYRIPKLLFQDNRFQPLSTDAKTLYGILLDRMSLSARNGWLDKAGRVFIIYTVQEVQDSLGCADKKATKLLRELEEYGLIERKRRGLGKPDLIYVKNFSSESSKLRFLNRDNDDSGVVQNTLQDPAKLRCNKTERNNTEISDTDFYSMLDEGQSNVEHNCDSFANSFLIPLDDFKQELAKSPIDEKRIEELARLYSVSREAVMYKLLTLGEITNNDYAAKNAQTTQAVEFNGSSEDLKLNVVYGAAHGTKCFTSGAVATAGDTIVLSYIDEFQFAGSDAGVVGVPNSDSDFGAGYAEGKVLMSKRVNADYYSKMMAEKAGSTVSLDANYDAIQNHVNGMSIADAEALSKDEKAVDAVSGATLVDTAGYVGVLVDAAK